MTTERDYLDPKQVNTIYMNHDRIYTLENPGFKNINYKFENVDDHIYIVANLEDEDSKKEYSDFSLTPDELEKTLLECIDKSQEIHERDEIKEEISKLRNKVLNMPYLVENEEIELQNCSVSMFTNEIYYANQIVFKISDLSDNKISGSIEGAIIIGNNKSESNYITARDENGTEFTINDVNVKDIEKTSQVMGYNVYTIRFNGKSVSRQETKKEKVQIIPKEQKKKTDNKIGIITSESSFKEFVNNIRKEFGIGSNSKQNKDKSSIKERFSKII